MTSPADTRFRESEYLAACQIAADQLQCPEDPRRSSFEQDLDDAASSIASRYRKHHEDVLHDIEEAMLHGR